MKNATRLTCLFCILLIATNSSIGQENPLTNKYKEQVILKLSQLMNDFYIFPKVAKSTEDHLMTQFKSGHFDQFENDETFAEALTKAVQSVNKDKHMRIRPRPPYVEAENSPERMIEERLYQLNRSRNFNLGLNNVKILEGNVGYLDLRGFAGMENGKEVADAYMKLMSRADAIIIDVSKNGGGSPRMVQYLCSYFFDKHLHLNSLYYREGNETQEYWTLDEVGGTKMPDIPLFVITGERTFSGAEEFSYNMQTQKRATLIGQTTGGGANPGRSMGINESLSVFIPTGRAINPITQTSWEGTGVIPEIKTAENESLDKAHTLAKEAAVSYRNQRKEQFTKLYKGLQKDLTSYTPDQSEKAILKGLTACRDVGLLQEWNINALGYEYLLEHKKPQIARSIFHANTILYNESANAHDSYAESLMMTGQSEQSIENYQKAVELATKHEDRDLELFKKNLSSAKQQLKSKK